MNGVNIIADVQSLLDAKTNRDGAKFQGRWDIDVYDNKESMKLIGHSSCHNIITDEGLNRILDVFLGGNGTNNTQTTTWYCSIFESNSTPAAGWTYDLYADSQCTEWQQYDETTRPAYVEATSSSKSVTNSTNKAVFTANTGAKTLYGAALLSVNTKGDHTAGANNRIFCAGTFAVAQPVIAANVVNLTYTVTAADDGV